MTYVSINEILSEDTGLMRQPQKIGNWKTFTNFWAREKMGKYLTSLLCDPAVTEREVIMARLMQSSTNQSMRVSIITAVIILINSIVDEESSSKKKVL